MSNRCTKHHPDQRTKEGTIQVAPGQKRRPAAYYACANSDGIDFAPSRDCCPGAPAPCGPFTLSGDPRHPAPADFSPIACIRCVGFHVSAEIASSLSYVCRDPMAAERISEVPPAH